MPVIILDRNVINLIKEVNSGKEIIDPNKQNMLLQLQKLDVPENKISPIFSIIEGQKGRVETLEEKERVAQIETAALKTFFKKAQIDIYPINNMKYLYSSIYTLGSFLNTKIAMEIFLKKASSLLQNIISAKKRESISEELFKLAKECKISSHEGGSLALLIALLCLYEDKNALKVVKFKKVKKIKLYNALNDIFHLINFIKIKAYLVNFDSRTNVSFLTMDKALNGLYSYIKNIGKKDINDQNLVAYTLEFSEALRDILPADILEKFLLYK
ncbi:hypothetical protein [Aggregatibacter segnis]|uniref:hypothetical protein n=1 Tax=Aggregatibacter segnis TaxID=739 RepID=UPI000D6E1806|nr:hypothetical protein [Aggregatibacter segnis]